MAGPLAIVAAVLIAVHDFVLRDVATASDVRTFWLPTYCFLGRTLAHGHIPVWNPHTMSGAPFAADPQSGWMYLPPMALFSVLPCDVAIRAMIVLQPVLAGLGLYWLLRGVGLDRAPATVGGLGLAVPIAGSNLAGTLPFSASLAWTALALAACARYLRADRWPARLGWLLATALAWGQLAAAHASTGWIIGSMALAAFAVGASVQGTRGAVGRARRAIGRLSLLALLALALIPVNLAFLLPRAALTPHTNLAIGYGGMVRLASALGSRGTGAGAGLAITPPWPLKLATTPGAHMGAIALALSMAALWNRRLRAVAVAFALFGAASFVLSLHVVSRAVPGGLRGARPVDIYLHNPYWFGFGLLLALAVLAGLGLQAWLEAGSWRARGLMVAPALLAWGVLPVAFGASIRQLSVLIVGAVVGALVLALLSARRARSAYLPPWVRSTLAGGGAGGLAGLAALVLAVELTVAAVAARHGPPFDPLLPKLGPLSPPKTDLARYLQGDGISRALRAGAGGRYATIGRGGVYDRTWNTGLLFGTRSVDGYDTIQLIRPWEFARLVNGAEPMRYNELFLVAPPPSVLDLLEVRWTVARRSRAPESGWVPVAREGPWALYRRRGVPPRASVVTSWRVQPDPRLASTAVASPGFDSARTAVLGGDPGIEPGAGAAEGGAARYAEEGPASIRVVADSPAPAVVVVRNSYDPRWRATVDGRPSRVLVADAIVQGVPIPAGRHVIELEYEDPAIGAGLIGSGASIGVIAALALLLTARRGRRRRKRARWERDGGP